MASYSAEFCKLLWNDLTPFLDCINFSYSTGHLSNSQRDGIAVMLPKLKKDPL